MQMWDLAEDNLEWYRVDVVDQAATYLLVVILDCILENWTFL